MLVHHFIEHTLIEEPLLKSRDPVFLEKSSGLWYFYTETWADSEGPFDTEVQARAALEAYCRSLG